MVDNDAALALAASGADDKTARFERTLGASEPLTRNFSRIRMTNEERSVAACVKAPQQLCAGLSCNICEQLHQRVVEQN